MNAITVRQPWASLIAAGVKTIETRPRRTAYRGRIAIHAAKAEPTRGDEYGTGWWWDWDVDHGIIVRQRGTWREHPAPLGAVVASAVLTDCVPIVNVDARWLNDGGPGRVEIGGVGRLWLCQENPPETWPTVKGVHDQAPYGDFSPGRWALLLDDIAPTTERCPWCWGEGGWGDGSADQCWCCLDAGRCDPVPARGQQAVPWEWTP